MAKAQNELEVYHAAERMLEHFGNCNTRVRANMLAAYFEWAESEAYYWRITDAVEKEMDYESEIEYWDQHKEL